MDTEHMREAITLAESGSFSRAASKLFMTQSSLSRHVSALERELGMALFDRTASGVEATEAGQVVIDAFGESEVILSQAIEKAKRIVNPEAVVTVGGCLSNDYAVAVLVEATDRLRRAGMASCVRFVDTGTRDYADRLADGEVDIVIAPRYGIAHGSDLRFRHLADVPFVCMMDAQNPLASKNSSGGGGLF